MFDSVVRIASLCPDAPIISLFAFITLVLIFATQAIVHEDAPQINDIFFRFFLIVQIIFIHLLNLIKRRYWVFNTFTFIFFEIPCLAKDAFQEHPGLIFERSFCPCYATLTTIFNQLRTMLLTLLVFKDKALLPLAHFRALRVFPCA